MRSLFYIGAIFSSFIGLIFFSFASGATVTIDASKLLPSVALSVSPRTGSFIEGGTFEVPISIDTRGTSINAVDIKVHYDEDKLSIVKPSSGQSIIGVWVEPPSYDNTRGVASYAGVIPNGITTKSGVIGVITFKAITSGRATVSIRSDSSVLLNDGLGSSAVVDVSQANYTITAKAPEGVRIFSETHPLQGSWYNNNTLVLAWEKEPRVTGFSFILDDKPTTIPDNTVDTPDTVKTYENLGDGLWYFHVKASKGGVWGGAGHFLVRIDTTPPAEFTPQASYVLAAAILVERTLVSFFTTDNLSGIDHYEVGVIDKSQPISGSPVFTETESPYQVQLSGGTGLRVIVRALDRAGNIRDASIDVRTPLPFSRFLNDYAVILLLGFVFVILLLFFIHYLYGHHIVAHFRRAFAIAKKEESEEHFKENKNEVVIPPSTVPPPAWKASEEIKAPIILPQNKPAIRDEHLPASHIDQLLK